MTFVPVTSTESKASPLPLRLLGLAWPLIISFMLFFVDAANVRYWLGHYHGVDGTAVHTTTATVVGLMALAFTGISMGCSVLVARSVGARDGRGLSLLGSAAALALVIWLVLASIVVAISGPLSEFLGKTTVPAEDIRTFLVWWCVLAVPAWAMAQLFVSTANGAGLTKFALSQGIVHVVISAGLLPLLLGPLGLGFRAPAIAICCASLVNVAQLWVRLARQAKERHLGDHVDRKVVTDTRVWRQIVDIGLPAQLSRATSWIVLIAVVLRVREVNVTVLAGYGIAMAFIDLAGSASAGFAGSAQILIAQNLGAKDPAAARRVLRTALWLSLGFPLLTLVISVVFAEPLAGLLASNPEAQTEAAHTFRLMVFVLFPATIWQVLLNAFAAARATKRVLLVTLVAHGIAFAISVLWSGDRIWGALVTIGTMYSVSVVFYFLLSIPVLWRGALADQPHAT